MFTCKAIVPPISGAHGVFMPVFLFPKIGYYLRIAGVLAGGEHVHLIHDLQNVGAKCPEDDAEVPLLYVCRQSSVLDAQQCMEQSTKEGDHNDARGDLRDGKR